MIILSEEPIYCHMIPLKERLSDANIIKILALHTSKQFNQKAKDIALDYFPLAPHRHAKKPVVVFACQKTYVTQHPNTHITTPFALTLSTCVHNSKEPKALCYQQEDRCWILVYGHGYLYYAKKGGMMQREALQEKARNTLSTLYPNLTLPAFETKTAAPIAVNTTPSLSKKHCHINLSPWRQQRSKRRFLSATIAISMALLITSILLLHWDQQLTEKKQRLSNTLKHIERHNHHLKKDNQAIARESHWQQLVSTIHHWNSITQRQQQLVTLIKGLHHFSNYQLLLDWQPKAWQATVSLANMNAAKQLIQSLKQSPAYRPLHLGTIRRKNHRIIITLAHKIP